MKNKILDNITNCTTMICKLTSSSYAEEQDKAMCGFIIQTIEKDLQQIDNLTDTDTDKLQVYQDRYEDYRNFLSQRLEKIQLVEKICEPIRSTDVQPKDDENITFNLDSIIFDDDDDNLEEVIDPNEFNFNNIDDEPIDLSAFSDDNEYDPLVIDDKDDRDYSPTSCRRVNNVESQACEEQNVSTLEVLKRAGKALLILAIITSTILLYKSCSKDKDSGKVVPDVPEETTHQTEVVDTTTEIDLPIITELNVNLIDIHDEQALNEYAKALQEGLKQNGYSISVDEIVKAIKLANFNAGDEKVFESKDDALQSTLNAGEIATRLGTKAIAKTDCQVDVNISEEYFQDIMNHQVIDNSLSIADLGIEKKDGSYSILDIQDALIAIINNSTKYNEIQRTSAQKAFTELAVRKTRSFTATPNSCEGQYYLTLGMFNAGKENAERLTAGRLWGPIYGDGTEIDDTYGFICIEEFEEYANINKADNNKFIVNPGTWFYNDLLEEDLVKSQGLNK